MINFIDNFISSIFNFFIRILGKRVNIDVNDYVDMEIIPAMLNFKSEDLKNQSQYKSETINLCTIPIKNMELYNRLKNQKELLVGINNKLPRNYIAVCIKSVSSDKLGVKIIKKNKLDIIFDSFREVKAFWKIGQIIGVVAIGINVYKFYNHFVCSIGQIPEIYALYTLIFLVTYYIVKKFQKYILISCCRFCVNNIIISFLGAFSSIVIMVLYINFLRIIWNSVLPFINKLTA